VTGTSILFSLNTNSFFLLAMYITFHHFLMNGTSFFQNCPSFFFFSTPCLNNLDENGKVLNIAKEFYISIESKFRTRSSARMWAKHLPYGASRHFISCGLASTK
jgi:hypothetical protein